MLRRLQDAVIADGNVFAALTDAVRVCSLGQITNALFEVGGQYDAQTTTRCLASAPVTAERGMPSSKVASRPPCATASPRR